MITFLLAAVDHALVIVMDPVHARTDCWKVLVSHFDHRAGRIVHRSVNACIAPLCSVADKAITTIEGVLPIAHS